MSSGNGPWMETVSHRRFYFLKPELSDICIADAAHHLSHESRFGGATQVEYCVAEHCIHHSELVRGGPALQLRGLCHDLHEYVVKDLTRPMKLALNILAGFDIVKKLVAPIDAAIEKQLGIDLTSEEDGRETEIKRCDNILLDVESRVILQSDQKDWVPFGILEHERMASHIFESLRLPFSMKEYRGVSYSDYCAAQFIEKYEILKKQIAEAEAWKEL